MQERLAEQPAPTLGLQSVTNIGYRNLERWMDRDCWMMTLVRESLVSSSHLSFGGAEISLGKQSLTGHHHN
jgi:hypothetical protein